jgi:hypothetical protein
MHLFGGKYTVTAWRLSMSTTPIKNPSHDLVMKGTRILAFIIVPVLFVAFVMLYLFPDHSGTLFAWPIKPKMSAMMLGATYLGGAFFFTMVVLARLWHTVRLGFLPVSAFAGILGIATLLHWDKFTPGHISFILWAILYFTLPFVIPVIWYLNQRLNQGTRLPEEIRFSVPLTLAFAGVGVVLTTASLVLLLAPQVLIPFWPWTLSPLTARVMSAMFALSGLVSLGVSYDRRWSSARVIFMAQVISILLILLAMLITRQDIAWGMWYTWTFVLGFGLVLVLIGWADLRYRQENG